LVSFIKERTQAQSVREQVLRKIFGPTREKITAGLTKLHKEKLKHKYSSRNIIWQIQPKEDVMSSVGPMHEGQCDLQILQE
jgi:hypothetical protein